MKIAFYAAILACAFSAAPSFAAETVNRDGGVLADIAPSHASMVAETFVATNISKGMAILNNAAETPQQRSEQFGALLLSLTDMKRVAVFTLGQYANAASQADQEAFVTAFQAYSTAVYRSYFDRFGGQTLIVTGSSLRAPDDFVVSTKLVDPSDHSGQASLMVNFRVRTDKGQPVVIDLGVMGVWLALAQRDEFGAFLGAHGGSVGALTENIRSVTARYR